MKLNSLRKKIDTIDGQVVTLLNKRAGLVKSVGKIKHKSGSSVYVPDREAEIYNNIVRKNKGPLSPGAVKAIYREIMSSSLTLEKDLKIAYLGPEATFTNLAAIKKFGSQVNYSPCNSIIEIFREVEVGRSDYGVVPVENSVEGAVSHTLDMFITSDLKICSEVLLDISHNLIGKCDMNSVKRVYSNPNVFGQCRIWLDSHLPKAELIEVASTSKAAYIASKEKGSSAIASVLAAEKYNLKILARNIEDSANNITRFLVIGQHIPSPTKNDKTSVMFYGREKIGALHDMLAPFKRNNINLTKIESRPSKKKAWEYYFFIDMLGHSEDPNVKKALKELRSVQGVHVKILGSYPLAT